MNHLSRPGCDHWNFGTAIVTTVLSTAGVIAGVNHQGVVAQSECLQFIHDRTNVIIHSGSHGIIPADPGGIRPRKDIVHGRKDANRQVLMGNDPVRTHPNVVSRDIIVRKTILTMRNRQGAVEEEGLAGGVALFDEF